MAEPRWAAVCEPEAATTALDTEQFCASVPSAVTSPIDDYYAYVEHLLTLGDETALAESQTLGRLLLLGLVSGVEAYFRRVLAQLLRTCPVARRAAAEQSIPYGAIDYYGVDGVEWGFLDGASLAGADEVASRTRKLTGIDVHQNSSARAALEEFDKVCHLRHAAVHARGTLGRGNASALGLGPDAGQLSLEVSLAVLHQAGFACHATVRAYNRHLYRKTVERWIAEPVIDGSWSKDNVLFSSLFALFVSKRDNVAPANAYQAYRALPKR